MASRLTFSERGHRYSVDGSWTPSVTSITSAALDSPGLRTWYASQAAIWAATNPDQLQALGYDTYVKTATDAPNRARDAAAGRGTKLHHHAEQLVTTGATDAPPEQVQLVEHAADFLDTWQVRPLASERFVFHEIYEYAGRLDLIASLGGDNDNLWLLDFKTGSGVYPDVALQLAAYRFASHITGELPTQDDQPMPPIAHVGVVWVRPEGWQLIPIRADRDIWQTFLSCIPIYQFARAKPDTIVGAPLARPQGAAQ